MSRDTAQHYRTLAEFYRQFGFNLIPLGADKRPVVVGVSRAGGIMHFRWEDWHTQAQTPAYWKQLRSPEWWSDVAGLAAITGPVSGDLVCIDFDTPTGRIDLQFPWSIVQAFIDASGLPPSWLVKSPRGGWHIWLRCPGLTLAKGKLNRPVNAPDLDGYHIELRHAEHYTALPGSQHPNGMYTWAGEQPTEAPPTIEPALLLAAYDAVTVQVAPAPVRSTPAAPPSNGVVAPAYALRALEDEAQQLRATVDHRNDATNKAAFSLGQLVGAGLLSEGDVENTLLDAAQATGLPEGEARATIRSGLTSGMKLPRQVPASTNGHHAPDGDEPYAFGFVIDTPDPLMIEADEEEAEPAKHITWPYAVQRGCMVLLRENKDGDIDSAPIADFACTISEEITAEEGGASLVLVGQGLRRGAFRCEISGVDFGSDARLLGALTEATGGIDVVYPNMSKHLRAAIGKLTTSAERVQRVRYFRTGWLDNEYNQFLLPGMDDATLLHLPAQMAYSAPPRGADEAVGLYALRCLIEALDPAVTLPVVAGLLLPPMHRPAGLGNERPALFVAGRTGSLKTSWMQVAMCLYGHEFASNDRLLKFGEGATRNAIMAFATHAPDMPLFIDNFKPSTGDGSRGLINLIHNLLEGADRARSDRTGALREARTLHCVPFATGEDFPRDDSSTMARSLVVQFAWQRGEANDNLSEAQLNSRHLNAVGYSWIQWIAGEGRQIVAEVALRFPAYRAKWAHALRNMDTNSANIARVASNIAVNELTWETALRHPTIGQTLLPFDAIYRRGIGDIAASMSRATAESQEAVQWRNAIQELLASGQYMLADRGLGQPATGHERDRLLGWRDSDGIYLLPAIALAAVKRLLGPMSIQVSPQTLYNQMEQFGWIARRDKDQTTRKVSIGGNKERVLHLIPTVLTASASGEDEVEDGEDELREFGL